MKINTLATVLKELREKNKFTQKEVAEKVNITQRAYAFYETGDREPSIDTLIKIANLYNVPIDILVGRYKLR
ncbi:helix-turn-helix transcriptional regulator [Ruminococcus sp.]|uniref:helix-turn-helix domain-containing protein n=1 Tax=Ruminococcus sp. TaxID=41978 RepID=UPI00258E4C38|nr:helix-turn-helix transcriptional regulator [Ruminococcus sp.]MCR5022538.1 helix-turn-helix transcriptional regulator [Ruminococcus sp.]